MKKEVKTLILGSGPTGLGAAYRLKELGDSDFLILEKENFYGGLATSFVDEKGFTWDIGGHVQFSHYKYFDEVMQKALGADGWNQHERESWVWIYDRFIAYPFQNNIRHLPKEALKKCLDGLVELYKNPVPLSNVKTFKDWIHATFGAGLAEVFMEPYNFKVWAFPTEEMSFEWVGERVAVTDLKRILNNLIDEKDDVSWGPNNKFQFPKKGGTGAIWNSVANLVGTEKIRLKSEVVSINMKKREVTLKTGEVFGYQSLLNTIPLDIFCALTDDLDAAAKAEAKKLKYSASNIVGIGLKGKLPATLHKKCWMYFPENNSPFYRVTVFSNYAVPHVPDPSTQWSLMSETSESSAKPVNQKTLLEDTINGMTASKLITSRDEIVSTWVYRADHGYPTPFVGRNEILVKIHKALEPNEVYSRGRFGGWKYEVANQDHSMMQGVEWVNRIKLKTPELTYFFPNTANANWGK